LTATTLGRAASGTSSGPPGRRLTRLFDGISDRLFSPLVSANREIWPALARDLCPLLFDRIHADVFPSRETVRQEIEQRLGVPSGARIPVGSKSRSFACLTSAAVCSRARR
jgi:hypothetical protein